ncbi:MAG: nucleoside hydrolase [Clostridia bacterium]|nr:nucleoside hydrolase [Clostridia bacterium]
MKKLLMLVVCLSMCLACAASAELTDYNVVTSAQTHKVIFDTDNETDWFGDDSFALLLLLQADAAGYIDLLGVTSAAANVTVAESTTANLNMLEAAGRGDIPVAIGTDVPLAGLHGDDTIAANGLTRINCMKQVLQYGDTVSYDNLGDLLVYAWGYSSLKPVEETAWEFMIEQVNKYPNQVTIMAVGACTNVAMAILSDPTFAEKTAGIYYMGGAIDVPGNDTPCAERNWYYDPEAVDICLRADFPLQVIVPNDISYNQKLTYDRINLIMNAGDNAMTRMIRENAFAKRFENNTDYRESLWDAQVPGIFMCPDFITKTDVRDVAIVTDMGYTYGESVAWEEGKGPENATTCTIVYDVDGDAYWQFMADMLGAQF